MSQKSGPLWFCLISLDRNILEGLSMFHLKDGIHRSIWSTKTFLYNIREPRYKQNNMRYKISRDLIKKNNIIILKSDTARIYV